MTTQRNYDHDSFIAYVSIIAAAEALTPKFPTEIIVRALLCKATDLMEGFAKREQWELIKSEALEIQGILEHEAAPNWSNVVDSDLVAENYNKRHE